MTKITVKDKSGTEREYNGRGLKMFRDGEMCEIYFNKRIDEVESRKVTVWVGHQPTSVEVFEGEEPKKQLPKPEQDPFTKEALKELDTPEEKALLETYQKIEGKKKRVRRTKAQIEADKLAALAMSEEAMIHEQ